MDDRAPHRPPPYPAGPSPAAGRPPAATPAPVTRSRAIAVTLLLAGAAAGVVALAVLRPLWLLAIPAAALAATVVGGLVLFVRARRAARERTAGGSSERPGAAP